MLLSVMNDNFFSNTVCQIMDVIFYLTCYVWTTLHKFIWLLRRVLRHILQSWYHWFYLCYFCLYWFEKGLVYFYRQLWRWMSNSYRNDIEVMAYHNSLNSCRQFVIDIPFACDRIHLSFEFFTNTPNLQYRHTCQLCVPILEAFFLLILCISRLWSNIFGIVANYTKQIVYWQWIREKLHWYLRL